MHLKINIQFLVCVLNFHYKENILKHVYVSRPANHPFYLLHGQMPPLYCDIHHVLYSEDHFCEFNLKCFS